MSNTRIKTKVFKNVDQDEFSYLNEPMTPEQKIKLFRKWEQAMKEKQEELDRLKDQTAIRPAE